MTPRDPSPPRWSIKTRLRVALTVLLILIVPQIGLTVYYLAELHTQSRSFSDLTSFVLQLNRMREALPEVRLPDESGDEARARFAAGVVRLESVAVELKNPSRSFVSLVSAQAGTLAADIKRVKDGVEAVTASGQQWFDSPDPSERTERRARHAMHVADLRERLEGALVHAYDRLQREEKYVGAVLLNADRNLIALTMITVVFVIVLVIALPTRIVRPLSQLTSAVRRAGLVSELPPIAAADEETKALADSFRDTMDRVRTIDALKRERIVEDTAKIGVLLDRIGSAAVLTPDLVVDASSPAFDRLVGRAPDDIDIPLPDLLNGGGEPLRRALQAALGEREPIEGREVVLTPADGRERPMRCDVDLCEKRGKIQHLVVVLSET